MDCGATRKSQGRSSQVIHPALVRADKVFRKRVHVIVYSSRRPCLQHQRPCSTDTPTVSTSLTLLLWCRRPYCSTHIVYKWGSVDLTIELKNFLMHAALHTNHTPSLNPAFRAFCRPICDVVLSSSGLFIVRFVIRSFYWSRVSFRNIFKTWDHCWLVCFSFKLFLYLYWS